MSEPGGGEGGGEGGGGSGPSGFAKFLGRAGSSAEQLFVWQILGQIISAAGTPFFQALTQAVLEADPNTPISPEQAASLVARNLAAHDWGSAQAAKSGTDGGHFGHLVDAAASAPPLAEVLELWRRGEIDTGTGDGAETSVYGAMANAGIRVGWWQLLAKLKVDWPSWQEIINAWEQGQLSEPEARQWLGKTSIPPDWIDVAYAATGQAPTPTQALELANRGIIPWEGEGRGAVSYRQAFLEGPWRNKWEPVFRALAEYIPPPRTITAMFHNGQLNHDQAAKYLMMNGLSAELAAAYLSPSHSSTATATEKHLAKTDILALYTDKIMDRPAAMKALESLKYTATDAGFLLDLEDLKATVSQLKAGVTRVRSLFQAGKLTAHDAVGALHQLGITGQQATDLVDTWQVTQAHAQVKQLTPAQVEGAVKYGLITPDDAIARLVTLGYEPSEAWLALAVSLHGTGGLPPRPPELGPPLTPPTSPSGA